MTESTKKCPYCAGEILATAKKCKHCKQWLVPPEEVLGGGEGKPMSSESPQGAVNSALLQTFLPDPQRK
jgi:hypothetical protein